MAGKVREVGVRVLCLAANRLIQHGLADTPGMPAGDAPDSRVGLLQFMDEVVGAEGGLMAGGYAKRCGFTTGERAQAVPPVIGRGPVAVELFGVEPAWRRC